MDVHKGISNGQNEASRENMKKRQLKDIDKEIYHYWP